MARWYLVAFTTGKRYPLFDALKKAFALRTIANRFTFLGEYKYEEGFDKEFSECVELTRDIHDLDPANGLYRLREVLVMEKYKIKNKIPQEQQISFDDLQYRDHFPDSFNGKLSEDMKLLKEMIEDSKIAHKDMLGDEKKYLSFYERVKKLEEIIQGNDNQTDKFDEYSCDPKYWS